MDIPILPAVTQNIFADSEEGAVVEPLPSPGEASACL